jgi:7-keto-8-aminopelargonate synthetase-like enzyme
MDEPFRTELDQLRARSLLRQLREIGSAQGPSVELVGQHLVNFSSKERKPASAIFPFIIGQENEAVCIAQGLQKEGFFVPAIRHPTVACGSARLRITVTATHTESQIRALADVIQKLR